MSNCFLMLHPMYRRRVALACSAAAAFFVAVTAPAASLADEPAATHPPADAPPSVEEHPSGGRQPSNAQPTEATAQFPIHPDASEHGSAVEHPHERAHGHHANHFAIFGGATTNFGETAPTLGIDYERRLPFASQMFGVGALIDVAKFHRASVIAAPALFFHPYGGFKVLVAPGVEHEGEEDALVVRGALSWSAHFDRVSVGPAAAVDIVHGHAAFVYGVDVGLGF